MRFYYKIFLIKILMFNSSVYTQVGVKPKTISKKSFIEDLTKIKNPIELRDPFKRPESITKKTFKKKQSYKNRTSLDNRPKPEGVSLRDVKKINGILMGENRRAIVDFGGQNFILKEGFVDKDGLELKAILPGGIIYVEKIVNVYGQEEFLETVVPISK